MWFYFVEPHENIYLALYSGIEPLASPLGPGHSSSELIEQKKKMGNPGKSIFQEYATETYIGLIESPFSIFSRS